MRLRSGATTFTAPSASSTSDPFYKPPNDKFLQARHYTALNESRLEIRLITNLWVDGKTVRCDLAKPIALRTTEPLPRFYALSYAAQDVQDQSSIIVNGTRFNVYSSLVRALKEVAYFLAGSSTGLWVDQICINQHDLVEKAWQVASMKDIYCSASGTYVFLDLPDDDNGEFSLSFLARTLEQRWEVAQFEGHDSHRGDAKLEDHRVPDRRQLLHASFLANVANELCHQLWNHELPFSVVHNVKRLCEATYWSRCWTQGEYIVSQSLRLLLGGRQTTSMNRIRWLSEAFFGVATSLLSDLPKTARLIDVPLEDTKRWLQDIRLSCSYGLGLAQLHIKWKFQETPDLRDGVYSALSMRNGPATIKPNYGSDNTVEDVFIEFASFMVEQDRCIDILGDAGEYLRLESSQLPSWVPDYGVHQGRGNLSDVMLGRVKHLTERRKFPAGEISGDCSVQKRSLAKQQSKISVEHLSLQLSIWTRWSSLYSEDLPGTFSGDDAVAANDASWRGLVDRRMQGSGTRAYQPKPQYDCEDMYAQTLDWGDLEHERALRSQYGGIVMPGLVERGCKVTEIKIDNKIDTSWSKIHKDESLSGKWQFFFTRADGIMGLVPTTTKPGDLLCLIPGGSTPFVLRPADDLSDPEGLSPPLYRNIGAAYVTGYMHGLAIEEKARGEWRKEEICIV
ncbi:uncharacterized protein AB675_9634 [Cyphellophora attinorum]|uniref:Heterokaryon incompatibility domain-containing protein n=1 Tax=Cyphellophora attinorum TaxID=1664694 RepID=A0A0N1NZS9_9EURO|nr:uncharacterized protein AB675_9634 [Phialophora attinorum]KPI42425.1 hypothetical protein AB675_9634 [Phialophora attinorum]